MTRTEFVTGSESRTDTGESQAKPTAQPANIQAFTWVMAMDTSPARTSPSTAPRSTTSGGTTSRGRRSRSCSAGLSYGAKDGVPGLGFDPAQEKPGWGTANLWTYRRVVAAAQHAPNSGVRDLSLINWGQNDYHLGPLLAVPADEAAKNLQRARQQSLSLLYWLQTDAPRPDGKVGYPGCDSFRAPPARRTASPSGRTSARAAASCRSSASRNRW